MARRWRAARERAKPRAKAQTTTIREEPMMASVGGSLAQVVLWPAAFSHCMYAVRGRHVSVLSGEDDGSRRRISQRNQHLAAQGDCAVTSQTPQVNSELYKVLLTSQPEKAGPVMHDVARDSVCLISSCQRPYC